MKAYFDRYSSQIDGLFTLNVDGKEIFKRLPARSGQGGYTHTSWIRGKSPIPYGLHYLWLTPRNVDQKPGYSGIGEFYPISNDLDNPDIIRDRDPRPVGVEEPRGQRMNIGLHAENALPGSAGCIVLLVDTPERQEQVDKLFAFLREAGKTMKHIPLQVL